MIIWLVGMMGVGKTSLGKRVAERLSVPFVDTDTMVESEAGMTIAGIWDDAGESGFRERERAAVRAASAVPGIVATGGGAILDEASREVMTGSGPVVWLQASPETLVERLGETTDRPAYVSSNGGELAFVERLLDSREPLYRSVSTKILDTDVLDQDTMAKEIEALWKP